MVSQYREINYTSFCLNKEFLVEITRKRSKESIVDMRENIAFLWFISIGMNQEPLWENKYVLLKMMPLASFLREVSLITTQHTTQSILLNKPCKKHGRCTLHLFERQIQIEGPNFMRIKVSRMERGEKLNLSIFLN